MVFLPEREVEFLNFYTINYRNGAVLRMNEIEFEDRFRQIFKFFNAHRARTRNLQHLQDEENVL